MKDINLDWSIPMEGSNFNFISFLPIVAIFLLMYLLIIRPQNKKAKEHQSMVQALKKGDKVVMSGGLIGTVSRIESETELLLELEGGAKARVLRSMVGSVLNSPATAAGTSSHQAKIAPVFDKTSEKAAKMAKTPKAKRATTTNTPKAGKASKGASKVTRPSQKAVQKKK